MTVSIYYIFKYISYFIFGIFAAVTDDLEWYGFIRAFISLEPAQINIDRWFRIDRNFALVAAILISLTKQGRKSK